MPFKPSKLEVILLVALACSLFALVSNMDYVDAVQRENVGLRAAKLNCPPSVTFRRVSP